MAYEADPSFILNERTGISWRVVYNLNLQFCVYIRLVYLFFPYLLQKLSPQISQNLEKRCHSVFCLRICMNVNGIHLSQVKEKLALKCGYGIPVP